MEINFLTVLIAVVSLVVLAIPGYIIVKTKLVSSSVSGAFSALVLYVCAPAQVFMGFQRARYSADIGTNMLIVAGVTLAVHLIMIGIMFLIIRGKKDEAKKRIVRLSGVFGNAAYMGLPFLQLLFPNSPEMIIYASVVISVFNAFTWTIGVYMITGNTKDISVKKVILHPVIIAVVLGLLCFFIIQKPFTELCAVGTTGYQFVSSLMKSVNMVGDMVTPTAMFVIGMRLANVNLKQLFLDKWAYVSAACKLVLMSLITILIVCLLPLDETVRYALFFLLSMPGAASCVLQSVQFGGDADFASVAVLLSTLLSILTIPVMFLLFGAII